MQLELAKLLCEHVYDAELYEEYSGRGMYGDYTAGITGVSLAYLLSEVLMNPFISQAIEDEGIQVSTFRTDSLGMDQIIY